MAAALTGCPSLSICPKHPPPPPPSLPFPFRRIDLLVNCSGILNPDGKGETSLRGVSQEFLQVCVCVCVSSRGKRVI